MNPLPVREETERYPRDRPQNVPTEIVPAAVESWSYWRMGIAQGLRAVFLSVWAHLWWVADRESAPLTGSFSTAFSSAFDGGIDSPQGAAFDGAFSSAFS